MTPPRRLKAAANFPPEVILAIRGEYAAGTLSPRAWADVWGVSPETIRKVARGDTYRHIRGEGEASEPPKPPSIIPPPAAEVDPPASEIEASLARLAQLSKETPP